MKTLSQHGNHGHTHHQAAAEAAAELMVSTFPKPARAGESVDVRLMIHAADGAMVRDFDIMHEEKVHLAIISEDLRHFAHVHPAVDRAGNMRVQHTFPSGGAYRLFADYTPAGGRPSVAASVVNVNGLSQAGSVPVPDAPGVVEADGVKATISADRLAAGSPSRLSFTLQDDRGEPLVLDPYMGELGHLMFIGVGTWQYVHVHPVAGIADRGTVEFDAHFTEPGLYKGWGQFKHEGRVRVVPFVVAVR